MKVTYGANFRFIGKEGFDQLSGSGAWTKTTTTLQGLADHIAKGHPWMPALLDGNGKRWQSNANYAEAIAADIDKGLTTNQALALPFVANYCALGIESASSTPEHNKFRLIFVLPEPLTCWQDIRLANLYLMECLGGTADRACKDASRFFFGAPGRVPFLLIERTLPADFMDKARQWKDEIDRKIEAEEQERQRLRELHWAHIDKDDVLQEVEEALLYAPQRSPGCGNYGDVVAIAAGLLNELGESTAISLLERYIPPHRTSNDQYNPERLVRDLSRGGSSGRKASLGSVFYICRQNGYRPKKRENYLPSSVVRFGRADKKETSGKLPKSDQPEVVATGAEDWKAKQKAQYKLLKKFTPDTVVHQEYIDLETPKTGAMLAVKSGLGTNKTGLGKGYVREFHSQGTGSIVYEPLNALGTSVTERINTNDDRTVSPIATHLQNYKAAYGNAKGLIEDLSSVLVQCPDSTTSFEPHNFNGRFVWIDEANSVANAFISRNTAIARDRANANYLLKECLSRCKAVYLCDGNLTDKTVEFFHNLAPHLKLTKVLNAHNSRKFTIKMLDDPSGQYIYKLIKRDIKTGPVLVPTDSKTDAETLDLELSRSGYRGYCLSSSTKDEAWAKEFLKNPDAFLAYYKPDYLIYTPTAESGIDINSANYFKGGVHAVFFGVVTTDRQTQTIARYRDTNIPRTVSCPKVGLRDSNRISLSMFEQKCLEQMSEYLLADGMAAIAGAPNQELLLQVLTNLVGTLQENPRVGAEAVETAIENYERANLFECLYEQLVESGHDVEIIKPDGEVVKDVEHAEAKKEVKIRESAAVFNAADISPEQAETISNSSSRTSDQQRSLEKHWIKERLPEIEKSEVWSEEFVHEVKFKPLISQCDLYFLLHHPEVAQLQNAKKWAKRIKYNKIDAQDAKSKSLKVKTLLELGLDQIINRCKQDPEWDFSENTDEIKQFFWACSKPTVQRKIGRAMGKCGAIEWVRSVLDSVGLKLEPTRKSRDGKKLVRFYRITEEILESEYAQAVLESLATKYTRFLEGLSLSSEDINEEIPFDFGLTGQDAEAVFLWAERLKKSSILIENFSLKNASSDSPQTLTTTSFEGEALSPVVSYINSCDSASPFEPENQTPDHPLEDAQMDQQEDCYHNHDNDNNTPDPDYVPTYNLKGKLGEWWCVGVDEAQGKAKMQSVAGWNIGYRVPIWVPLDEVIEIRQVA